MDGYTVVRQEIVPLIEEQTELGKKHVSVQICKVNLPLKVSLFQAEWALSL